MSIKEKEQLTEKQMSILNSEMDKRKKSVGLSYVLFIFFGSLGVHKFYLGNKKMGIIYLVLGIFGWIAILTGSISAISSEGASGGGASIIGLICIIVLAIMLLVDLFTIPKQVRKKYEEEEQIVIDSLLNNNQ